MNHHSTAQDCSALRIAMVQRKERLVVYSPKIITQLACVLDTCSILHVGSLLRGVGLCLKFAWRILYVGIGKGFSTTGTPWSSRIRRHTSGYDVPRLQREL